MRTLALRRRAMSTWISTWCFISKYGDIGCFPTSPVVKSRLDDLPVGRYEYRMLTLSDRRYTVSYQPCGVLPAPCETNKHNNRWSLLEILNTALRYHLRAVNSSLTILITSLGLGSGSEPLLKGPLSLNGLNEVFATIEVNVRF